MSVLLSQFVPSSPSPTACTSLFSASVPLFLPANRLISTIFLDPMHACMLSYFGRVWLFETLWTVAH